MEFTKLVHYQSRLCEMRYSDTHETSNIRTFAFEKRAREP